MEYHLHPTREAGDPPAAKIREQVVDPYDIRLKTLDFAGRIRTDASSNSQGGSCFVERLTLQIVGPGREEFDVVTGAAQRGDFRLDDYIFPTRGARPVVTVHDGDTNDDLPSDWSTAATGAPPPVLGEAIAGRLVTKRMSTPEAIMGKRNLLGVLINDVEPDSTIETVMRAARDRQPLTVAAIPVHPVMEGVQDEHFRGILNRIDLTCPDGQPVRWALNLLYGTKLRERVYGPHLMLSLCERAAADRLPIYLYGSTPATRAALRKALDTRFPGLEIAGEAPDEWQTLDTDAQDQLAEKINASGARIVFVGLGCPRQEEFAWAMRDRINAPLIAVGAAFDFNAGLVKEAPAWMMRSGLQWLHRLLTQPRRLWRRYLILNPWYVGAFLAQWLRLWRPDARTPEPARRPIAG